MKNIQQLKRITVNITERQYAWLHEQAAQHALGYQPFLRMLLEHHIYQDTEAQHHDQTTHPYASWLQSALSGYASGTE